MFGLVAAELRMVAFRRAGSLLPGCCSESGDGAGVSSLSSGNLLAWFTLSYPALKATDVVSFSLNATTSFLMSDLGSGMLDEDLVLRGKTQIPNVPIPGAIWLLGSGLAGMAVVARRLKK